MKCLLCGHDKVHKHGKTKKGHQRYKGPQCSKTFPEHFHTLEYGRHLSRTEVHTILQSHAEGSSLRGVSGISRSSLRHSGLCGQSSQSKSSDGSQCTSPADTDIRNQ